MRHDPNIEPSKRTMLLKREVLDMKLEGVFPDKYQPEFFKRFPELDNRKNARLLTDVMNSRSADETLVCALRKWYHELKKEKEANDAAA